MTGNKSAVHWVRLGMAVERYMAEIKTAGKAEFDRIRNELKEEGKSNEEIDEMIGLICFTVMCDCKPDIADELNEAAQLEGGAGHNADAHMVGYI